MNNLLSQNKKVKTIKKTSPTKLFKLLRVYSSKYFLTLGINSRPTIDNISYIFKLSYSTTVEYKSLCFQKQNKKQCNVKKSSIVQKVEFTMVWWKY